MILRVTFQTLPGTFKNRIHRIMYKVMSQEIVGYQTLDVTQLEVVTSSRVRLVANDWCLMNTIIVIFITKSPKVTSALAWNHQRTISYHLIRFKKSRRWKPGSSSTSISLVLMGNLLNMTKNFINVWVLATKTKQNRNFHKWSLPNSRLANNQITI